MTTLPKTYVTRHGHRTGQPRGNLKHADRTGRGGGPCCRHAVNKYQRRRQTPSTGLGLRKTPDPPPLSPKPWSRPPTRPQSLASPQGCSHRQITRHPCQPCVKCQSLADRLGTGVVFASHKIHDPVKLLTELRQSEWSVRGT